MKKFEAILLNTDGDRFRQPIDFQGYNFAIEEVSDGYHTFDELYNHRYALFCALTKIYDNYITPLNSRVKCWKSKLHSDGTMFDDSFIAGMTITNFQDTTHITYHMPLSWWDKFNLIIHDKAPCEEVSSDDVIERLIRL